MEMVGGRLSTSHITDQTRDGAQQRASAVSQLPLSSTASQYAQEVSSMHPVLFLGSSAGSGLALLLRGIAIKQPKAAAAESLAQTEPGT